MALAAALLLSGCASRGPRGPVVSPTGIVYEPGVPPVDTRFSQTATLYLRQGVPDRALELALEGVAADPGNPAHWMVAGLAHARLSRYEEAHHAFTEAQRLYPAYELDIEPEREAAWTEAFNAGAVAYGAGDVAAALEAWTDAALIFELRPEAHRNLASLLTAEGRRAEAIEVYERALAGLARRPATRVLREDEVRARAELAAETEDALSRLLLVEGRYAEAEPFVRRRLEREPGSIVGRRDLAAVLTGLGRDVEAAALYTELLSEASMSAADLLDLGISFFRFSDYRQAGEAFARLTELRPESRDAWFNRANALLAAGAWDSLVTVGARLAELDPLGENAALIAARAHLETGDPQAALAWVEKAEAAPVHVSDLRLVPTTGSTRVLGRMVGNQADAGTALRLRFTFYGDAGAVGAETVELQAPPPGETAQFELSFAAPAAAYRYEVVP